MASSFQPAAFNSSNQPCRHQPNRSKRNETGIPHPWRLAKGQNDKKPHYLPNKGVRFADKIYLDPKMISNKFAHQFTPPPISLTGDKSKRQLKQQFHQLPLTGTPSFMPADTNELIQLAKSYTAIGPGGMSTLQLKKLAHGAINYLTNIFNLSISTGQIPEIWNNAIIIPILKPGKDNNIGKNWPQHISVVSAQLHQQQKTDSVNCQIYRNTFHARYSRAPPTYTSEVGRPSTNTQNKAKSVRSDASHPSHFHTTLQQYRSKSASTQ